MTGLDASLSAGGAKKAEAGIAGLGKQLAVIPGPAGKAAGSLNNLFASMGTGGQMMAVAAAGMIAATALYKIADAAAEVQKIDAQTNAVIASTGGVANVTAGHVDKLANNLRNMSGVDDEVIKSGENIMLTFRGVQNIGKDKIFDQAVTSSLDLSIALGKDLSDSAIKVGKALQDPVRGLTALRRYGVQFSDEQETMIKKMVAVGDVMGAQKVILAELNAEFGGSAAALGGTFQGQLDKAKSLLHDFMEEAGKPMLGTLTGSLQGLGGVLQGMSYLKLPQIATWAYTAINPLLTLGALINGIQKAFGKGTKTEKAIDFSGSKKEIAGIVAEIKKVKGEDIVIHTETATANVQKLKAELEKATGKKITIETTGAGNAVDSLDKKVQQLDQDIKDALEVPSAQVKELEDTLALKGIKGVDKDLLKPMLDQLKADEPVVRDEGNKMAKDLVDALGRSNQGIKDNASKIGDDIAMGVEQARALGPVTDKKMAEIVLSVIKASGPVDAAGQVMLDNLQAIINGTPIEIPKPTTTPPDPITLPPPDEKNVDNAKAHSLGGWAAGVLTPTVDESNVNAAKVRGTGGWAAGVLTPTVDESYINAARSRATQGWAAVLTVTTQTQVNPTFDYPEDAGKYMAQKLQEGAGKVAPKMAMTAGISGASAALTSTFGSFIAEMNAAPILEVENAVNALTTADWGLIAAQQAGDRAFNTRQKQLEQQALTAEVNGNKDEAERVRGAAAAEAKVHDLDMINRELNATNKTNEESIGIWRNANAAYDAGTAGLTKYTNAIKSHENTIASLNRSLAVNDKTIAGYNKQIEKLDESTKPYEKQIRDLDNTTKAYEKQVRDLDDQLKVLDKSMQDSETLASGYQKTLDKFSSMKFAGEGAASDLSFAQDEESKKLQLEIMKAEDAHNYALAAKLTIQKDALDRKKEEAELQTSITYDPQKRELEKLLDPLHGQEATEKEIVAQITAAQAGLDKEKTIQETLKLQQDGIKARQEDIARLERNIADQQDAIRDKIQVVVDREELLRAKVEVIEDKQEAIRAKIAAQDKAVAKLNKEYDKAKAKVDKFKEQIDDLASFFVSKYGKMKDAVTGLNNAIGGGGTIPHYQTGTSYVPATGLAVVHEGEQIIPKLRPMQMHMTSDTQVTIPLYLDGKVLAKTVTKIQGGNASAYSASGGKY